MKKLKGKSLPLYRLYKKQRVRKIKTILNIVTTASLFIITLAILVALLVKIWN